MLEGDIIRLKDSRPLKNEQQSITADSSPKAAEPEKKVEEKKKPKKIKTKKKKKVVKEAEKSSVPPVPVKE
jgi:hypothetical protein